MADEEEEVVPPVCITRDQIRERIVSGNPPIDKLVEGAGLAITTLNLSELEFNDLSTPCLQDYNHLRHIDVSKNQIKSLAPIGIGFPNMHTLNGSENELSDVDQFKDFNTPYLQVVNLSTNKFETVPKMTALSSLKTLDISACQLIALEGIAGCNSLESLRCVGNQLTNLAGLFDLPNLSSVYAAGNQITSLEGTLNLPKLSVLHVRGNQIETLDGLAGLESVTKVNLRENPIAAAGELAKLSAACPQLSVLSIQGTPLGDENEHEQLVLEVIITAASVQTLNKQKVTHDDRNRATALQAERVAQQTIDIAKESMQAALDNLATAKDPPPPPEEDSEEPAPVVLSVEDAVAGLKKAVEQCAGHINEEEDEEGAALVQSLKDAIAEAEAPPPAEEE